jgi:hypothetical protein
LFNHQGKLFMGSFYTTATTYGPTQEQVVAEVKSIKSFISPTMDKFTVFYPDTMSINPSDISKIFSGISEALSSPLFVASVYDSDVFFYELWENGKLVDRYNSDPSAFGDGGSRKPKGGDVKKLCVIFPCKDSGKLEKILNTQRGGGAYVFEDDRHANVAEELGLPKHSVGYGYTYIQNGELPDGLTMEMLKETP